MVERPTIKARFQANSKDHQRRVEEKIASAGCFKDQAGTQQSRGNDDVCPSLVEINRRT